MWPCAWDTEPRHPLVTALINKQIDLAQKMVKDLQPSGITPHNAWNAIYHAFQLPVDNAREFAEALFPSFTKEDPVGDNLPLLPPICALITEYRNTQL